MGAQIRTGKRLPDTGKRFRDRIRAYDGIIHPNPVSESFSGIGESFSGVDLYPPFHFQITVEPPRLIFFLIDAAEVREEERERADEVGEPPPRQRDHRRLPLGARRLWVYPYCRRISAASASRIASPIFFRLLVLCALIPSHNSRSSVGFIRVCATWLRKKTKRRCREMKMGAQIRTGKRLPDTGKRFRDRIWAYAQGTQLLALSEFPISIGKSFSGADLYPRFHFQITVEPPRSALDLFSKPCSLGWCLRK